MLNSCFAEFMNVDADRKDAIFAPGGVVRMTKLGEKILADIATEEVQDDVERRKVGKMRGLDAVSVELLKRGEVTVIYVHLCPINDCDLCRV